MRSSLRTLLAAAIVPAATLTAACGQSPLEPSAPATAADKPQNSGGWVVSWGQKNETPTPTAQPQNSGGWVVSWGTVEGK